MSIRYFFTILFCSVLSHCLQAQGTPPLERIISVDIRNQRLEDALRQISSAGRFEFAYSPSHIDGNALVSIRLTNAPVRQVLSQLFANSVTVKSRGNHLILLKADQPDPAPKSLLLDGYILDEQTGERIGQASIFEKTTLASTVSNPFGYYRIKLPTDIPVIRLDVRKQAYVGESVTIRGKFTHSVNVRLKPLPPQVSVAALPIRRTEDTTRPADPLASVSVSMPAVVPDSTPESKPSLLDRGRMSIMNLFVSAQQAVHDINLSRDTLYRDWQVSFVPYIGTNHRLSGRIVNRISVNMLAGYSFGVRSFEVGGLLNLVQADVYGFQAGGLGNLVGREVIGTQIGGLFNVNGGSVSGFQAGGLFNVNMKNARGVQVGGLFNTTLGEQRGMVQIGGLMNVAGQTLTGVQIAGILNVARQDVHGWQISGILNRARRITGGHQIGLINLADSAGNVPFGLLSHVRKGGYRRVEVSTNEVNLLNVTYRTGVRQFYNILTAGTSFDRPGSPQLSAGYGIGTAFRLSSRTLLGLELTASHLFYLPTNFNDWNQHIRFSPTVETKLNRHVSLAFGPTVNWYFSEDPTVPPLMQPTFALFHDYLPQRSNSYHWGWVGFQVGLRFGNP
ncbi:hypothetical protein GCM10028806_30190 [Spirosoma terrae]|uniref:Secretin/TonB short N-terminal domain-containing protein n=1 Tax=Spirosoma terrae TaxID=1968276 RepID=A0A6L9L974_9BACT|nr:STN and carboxypeptidase regulatory-like domain-containing protein [Spirosoma terrae]NDU95333.1 hypothetical protein [Spirosoma terrae]